MEGVQGEGGGGGADAVSEPEDAEGEVAAGGADTALSRGAKSPQGGYTRSMVRSAIARLDSTLPLSRAVGRGHHLGRSRRHPRIVSVDGA